MVAVIGLQDQPFRKTKEVELKFAADIVAKRLRNAQSRLLEVLMPFEAGSSEFSL
jgi:hypothetical protein